MDQHELILKKNISNIRSKQGGFCYSLLLMALKWTYNQSCFGSLNACVSETGPWSYIQDYLFDAYIYELIQRSALFFAGNYRPPLSPCMWLWYHTCFLNGDVSALANCFCQQLCLF